MTTFHAKLALSALAIATLATPALAQGRHHQAPRQELYNSATEAPSSVGTYPNGAQRTGSVYSRESGADDNVIR